MKIRLGHSPDADDAFMFYGLATGKIDTGDYQVEHILEDIQTLNDRATRGEYEVTAVSAHAYAYCRDKYVLTRCGGSFGEGYGPKIVSREPMEPAALAQARIAVPGITTSAYLALQLCHPGMRTQVLPFDKIIPAVSNGMVDFGLIIHDGQLTYATGGLHCVEDLGQWWAKKHGDLPLPLGCNAVRSDLPPKVRRDLAALVLATIRYSLDHRREAVSHAMQFARDLERAQADEFIGMYVNQLTLDMGDRGIKSMETLLSQGREAGIIPNALPLEFVPEA